MKKCDLVTITPEFAAKLLATNYEKQRNLRKRLVAKYASDMEEGRWNSDTGMIIVDSMGRLIDGQHRLAAVVNAGVSIDMWVMVGADTGAFELIDGGAMRKIADVIPVERNKRACSAICNVMVGLTRYGRSFRAVLHAGSFGSRSEIIEYCDDNLSKIESAGAMFARVRFLLEKGSAKALGTALLMAGDENMAVVDYVVEDLAKPMPQDQSVAMFKMAWMRKAAANDLGAEDQFAMMIELFEDVITGKPFPSRVYTDKIIDRVQKRYDETGCVLSYI